MKPTILVLVGRYLPGFKSGGPIRTIANLVSRLPQDYRWLILTSDRDAGDIGPYAGIQPGAWNQVGAASVYYASPAEKTPAGMLRIINSVAFDAMYLNSFFDPLFSATPLILRRLGAIPRRPTLLAPRGEFAPSALALKPAKKYAFRAVARSVGLHSDVMWQASSPFEQADIQRTTGGGSHCIAVAQDLAPPAPAMGAGPPDADVLSLVFISRLAPMKNLDYALRILSEVGFPVRFDVYGPRTDEGYVRECEALISALPPHVHVRLLGEVQPDRVHTVLGAYDLMFLPTRGENYGHAIHEALVSGTPVLISDRTPWRGMREACAGFDLPLDEPEAFVAALESYARASIEDRWRMRQGARSIGLQKSEGKEDIAATRDMFAALLRQSNPPSPLLTSA